MFNTDLTPKRHINPNIFTSMPTHALIWLSVETITIRPNIKAKQLKTIKGPSKRFTTRRTLRDDSHFQLFVPESFEDLEKKRFWVLLLTPVTQGKLLLLKTQPMSKLFFI